MLPGIPAPVAELEHELNPKPGRGRPGPAPLRPRASGEPRAGAGGRHKGGAGPLRSGVLPGGSRPPSPAARPARYLKKKPQDEFLPGDAQSPWTYDLLYVGVTGVFVCAET